MDKKDVYLNLIQKNGLTNRYLNELDLMDTMFVDPITERILKKMGEPITFRGLLRRANEMLTNDAHPRETDAFNQHIFKQQRIAGAVYTEMVRSIREYRNKPGTRKKLEMQQNAVWQLISQDPSVMPASNANPIQSMKEADVVTFGGEGGRSRRSMVKHTREYLESDIGLISEATVDSGDVAITSYMTANPIFEDIDGAIKNTPKRDLDISQKLSSYALLAPFSTYDRSFVSES
jgi:3D (Asp-Asp-Asp) domain-containing protein